MMRRRAKRRHPRVPALVWLAVAAFLTVVGRLEAAGGEVLAEFDVAPEGDAVLVPVSIGGTEYPFWFSTSRETSSFDEALRPLLGPPVPTWVDTAVGEDTEERYRAPAAAVGSVRLAFPYGVHCRDHSDISRTLGYKSYGVLGMDALQRHVVQVDFDEGKLRFLKTAASAAGQPVLIKFAGPHGRKPQVVIEIPGAAMERALIDTGKLGESLVLHSGLFRALQNHETLPKVRSQIIWYQQKRCEVRRGRIDAAKIGGLRHQSVLCRESVVNVLGLEFLARYVITFDFPNSRLFLKEGRRFREGDLLYTPAENRLERTESGVVVVRADSQGPSRSTRLGLESGDVIERINGLDFRRVSNWYVRRALGTDDRRIELVVRRGADQIKLSAEVGEPHDANAQSAKNDRSVQ